MRLGLEPLEQRKLLAVDCSIIGPLDNGLRDSDTDDDELTIDMVQPAFQIELGDADGIDDSTVDSGDVVLKKDGNTLTEGTDYDFSYDAASDVVTLTSTISADNNLFKNDDYDIEIKSDSIKDGLGNWIAGKTFDLLITGSDSNTFTIAVLPDTQNYTTSDTRKAIFEGQTQWIVDNIQTENIVFVSHVGDVVQTSNEPSHWTRARGAMDKLDDLDPTGERDYPDGLLPYGVCPGNHDLKDDDGVNFKKSENYGSGRYSGRDWYGGTPDSGTYPNAADFNHYQKFSACGYDFLHISLTWGETEWGSNIDQAVTWAKSVIDQADNRDLPVIVSTHSYLETDGTRTDQGDTIFDDLIEERPQIFMLLCGHRHWAVRTVSHNDAEQPVYELLADYQDLANGGDGYLRLMKFLPEEDRIEVRTYSEYNKDDAPYLIDVQNEFELSFDFDEHFNGDLPAARLTAPEDNGSSDFLPGLYEVLVDTAQSSFVIQLGDYKPSTQQFDRIDDATVTSSTVSMTKDGSSASYDFAYNSTTNAITLTPSSGNFEIGEYEITVNGGASKIEDLEGNELPETIFTITIHPEGGEWDYLDLGSSCTALVPTDGSVGTTWTTLKFVDSSWTSGPLGVGYDQDTRYDGLIGLDVESAMYNTNATVYVRTTFDVRDPADLMDLTLYLKYDDGFVAYINGTEVARTNAPATPAWNSTATQDHLDKFAEKFEGFSLNDFVEQGVVRAGTNVLAIHGLNKSTTSTDMLIMPKLTAIGMLKSRICDPLDNGLRDSDTDDDELTVDMVQPAFKIELGDPAGIDDSTVAAGDVVLKKEGNTLTEGTDYDFSYDSSSDVITLTSTIWWDDNLFKNGDYELQIASQSIKDGDGNWLAAKTFDLTITGNDSNTFTVAALPDTQFYSQDYPAIFKGQTEWIVKNVQNENIVFVSHLGDVVDDDLQAQWDNAEAAVVELDQLDAGSVDYQDGLLPYGVCMGNHDDGSSGDGDHFNDNYGESRYVHYDWYGGNSANDLSHYQLFSACGYDFLHISLEFGEDNAERDAACAWAEGVIDANPNLPVILSTHSYLNGSGNLTGDGGTRIFEKLVDTRPQIFMVLCGHVSDAARSVRYNDAHLPVYEILSDYQGTGDGGDGYLRLMTFMPEENRIRVRTYSDYKKTVAPYMTDAENDFSLYFDFDERFNVVPPAARLETPEDFGSSDLDPDRHEVLVDAAQSSFVIQLGDYDAATEQFDRIDDATVTSSTVEMTKNGMSVSYNFAYNGTNNEITLTPTAGNFETGAYEITLNGGTSKIEDLEDNALPETTLSVTIDPGADDWTLLDLNTSSTALVPTDGSLGLTWTAVDFNDGSWDTGSLGVGYERGSGYGSLINLDVENDMYNTNCTVYVRTEFEVRDPADLVDLALHVKYDDGFVAYINGTEVARANGVDPLAWNSAATQKHPDSQATQFEEYFLYDSLQEGVLQVGTNVLAIHGLNESLTSSDMLILPKLVASGMLSAPYSSVIDPLDNGLRDSDTDDDELTVDMVQPAFKIELGDPDLIDDSTVGAGDFVLKKDGNTLTEGTDYDFSYDADRDVVTLTSTISSDNNLFLNDDYEIQITGSSIKDQLGNWIAAKTFDLTITGADSNTFSLVVLPDTQHYAENQTTTDYPNGLKEIFNEQTQWIVDNVQTENIVFVSHLGDVVEDQDAEQEWINADEAMEKLDALDQTGSGNFPDGLLPYSVCQGNHDKNDTAFARYFGEARYAGSGWYGGTPNDASAAHANHYQLFSACGYDLLHINLEHDPPSAAINWAKDVIDAHPDLPVILSTHSYRKIDGTYSGAGTNILNNLVKIRPQIFMVLCVHSFGAARHVAMNDFGLPVHELVFEYQVDPDERPEFNGGDGYLRIVKFLPDEKQIEVKGYSPTVGGGTYLTDHGNQFTIDIDFDRRFQAGVPTAVLSAPEDFWFSSAGPGEGVDDLDAAEDVVLVDSAQASFVIDLADYDGGIDDSSVTSSTVSMTKNGSSVSYNFGYNSTSDQITLTPTSGNFESGRYEILLNGSTSKIKDADSPANELPATTLTVVIDSSIAQTTLVDEGSTWKYLDDGSDQGASWSQSSFDDSGWSSGAAELGYGDGDETTVVGYGGDPDNKYITTYFRHSFDVPNADHVHSLTLSLLRDDGAVVYLNGNEIKRSNMPLLGIDYQTRAWSRIGGAGESAWHDYGLYDPEILGDLVDGTNVLAVEIHQYVKDSTDISFDLKLTAEVSAITHSFASGTLEIFGTPFADEITVSASSGKVTVNGDELDPAVNAADVTLMKVWGYDGDDDVDASGVTTANGFSMGLDYDEIFFCGRGDDTIIGSEFADYIYGEAGNDSISGGAGNDRIYGQGGDDILQGGAGSDIYYFTGSSNLGSDSISETSGTADALSFSSFAAAVDVNIASTSQQTVASGKLVLTLGSGTAIENVYGTSYADTIRGNSLANSLSGSSGNDTIYGGSGADHLYGGTGDDLIYGESGNDTIYAGNGDDTAYGGSDADVIYGDDSCTSAGDDVLYGDSGNDTIYGDYGDLCAYGGADNAYGGSGNDVLYGEGGNDYLFGGDDDDSAYGGYGNDGIYGDDDAAYGGNDTLYGEHGNDTIYCDDGSRSSDGGDDYAYGGYGGDALYGEGGRDHLYGEDGDDTMYGGYTNEYSYGDYLYGGSENDTLYGDEGQGGAYGEDDYLDCGTGADTAYGEGGDDTAYGGSGNDTVYGGSGSDDIHGGSDADWLYGGSGNDVIHGDAGNDAAYGGDGNDNISGGDDDDYLYGDDYGGYAGDDTLNGDAGSDTIYCDDGSRSSYGGDDYAYGGTGDDSIYGEGGEDHLYGEDGADTMYGGYTDEYSYGDYLYGGSENDTLYGDEGQGGAYGEDDYLDCGSGADTAYGEGGDDTIYGWAGIDSLYGGYGNDVIYGGTEGDWIYGEAGDDKIYGDSGADWIHCGSGDDEAYGGSGDDTINGYSGSDLIYGGDDDDYLDGGWQNSAPTDQDTVYGEAGDDDIYINDGDGNDTADGGTGTDTACYDYGDTVTNIP